MKIYELAKNPKIYIKIPGGDSKFDFSNTLPIVLAGVLAPIISWFVFWTRLSQNKWRTR